MATGDTAFAAGMDIIDSTQTEANTLGEEINKTRDYLATRSPNVTPIAKGGTGSTTAAAARAALGVQATVTAVTNAAVTAAEGVLVKGGAGGRIRVGTPAQATDAANKSYVDAILATASPTAQEGKLLVGGIGGRVNVGTPTVADNATTKAYVDAQITELRQLVDDIAGLQGDLGSFLNHVSNSLAELNSRVSALEAAQ